MKKMAAGCFAVACVLAVLVALLAGVGYLREERQRELPPMTLQDLDQIAKGMLNPSGAPTGTTGTGVEAPGSSPAEQNTQAGLPRRLQRTATDEERRRLITWNTGIDDKLFAWFGTSPLGGVADTVALAAGIPDGASWERAQASLNSERWGDARKYFEEVVRKSDRPWLREHACAYLAWLEEDPEIAARYMELACVDGDQVGLSFSASLASTTGSTELAKYYNSLLEKAREQSARGPAK